MISDVGGTVSASDDRLYVTESLKYFNGAVLTAKVLSTVLQPSDSFFGAVLQWLLSFAFMQYKYFKTLLTKFNYFL